MRVYAELKTIKFIINPEKNVVLIYFLEPRALLHVNSRSMQGVSENAWQWGKEWLNDALRYAFLVFPFGCEWLLCCSPLDCTTILMTQLKWWELLPEFGRETWGVQASWGDLVSTEGRVVFSSRVWIWELDWIRSRQSVMSSYSACYLGNVWFYK
jgi:hypothetical protein